MFNEVSSVVNSSTTAYTMGATIPSQPSFSGSPTATTTSSSAPVSTAPSDTITKFTNCRLLRSFPSASSHTTVTYKLVKEDLWISSLTGTIIDGQEVFYIQKRKPDVVIDCHNKILSPGLIDLQLNGAFGINFSDVPTVQEGRTEDVGNEYKRLLEEVNRRLVATGVTSYLPTLTSQRGEVYHQLLQHLGPSGGERKPENGSESLGAHIEGPFLSRTKAGIHVPSTLRTASNGYKDLDECYGEGWERYGAMITAAPEEGIIPLIPEIVNKGLVYSIGHSEATYEEAQEAVAGGATMITHLFNAMRPLHHRNPGVFGVLGSTECQSSTAPPSPTSRNCSSSVTGAENGKTGRPFYGLISDGIHLHPTTIKIAYSSHPSVETEEGRDKRRNATGSGTYTKIRRYPNGETRHT